MYSRVHVRKEKTQRKMSSMDFSDRRSCSFISSGLPASFCAQESLDTRRGGKTEKREKQQRLAISCIPFALPAPSSRAL